MNKMWTARRLRAGVVVALVGSVATAGALASPASAAGVTHWVDAAAASGGTGTGCGADAAYTTVQAAVTAATADDIVEVCPGTYTGNVTISNKAGLTLRGAKAGVPAGPDENPAGRGSGESIISVATTAAAILVSGSTSSNVTIDGLTVQNTAGTGININSGSVTGIDIVNTIIEGTNTAGTGIVSSTFNGFRIANNRVTNARVGMVLTGQLTNAPSVIEDNRVTGWASGQNGIILGSNSAPGHEISGNTLVATASIAINTPPNQVTISDNTITGTGSTGIFLPASGSASGAQVIGNDISGYGTGLWYNPPASTPPEGTPVNEVHDNNFTNNSAFAIRNNGVAGVWDLDATCNWYGDASGPEVPVATAGPADAVTLGVTYIPWSIAANPGAACTGGLVSPPALSAGDASGLERDSVTGSVFVPVFLTRASDEPTVVSFYTADGTATAGVDYTRWGTPSAPRTITIPAGVLQSTINVPVLPDGVEEGDETFTVVIAGVSGGDVTLGAASGTATIVDADAISVTNPAITVSSGTVVEGDDGQRRAQFFIHLSRPPATNVTITYTTADGTATAPGDYIAKLPGTVVFAPGQISKTVDVLVNSDTEVGTGRDFVLDVAVTGGSPVEEIAMTGVSTIVDDD
jgi:hypothetical protein